MSISGSATISIVNGLTAPVTATVLPANAANKGLIWSSSDAQVATVDQSGVITAVGVGTATITVTTSDGPYTATVAVTVTPILVSSVSISGSATISIVNGLTATVTATVLPTNAANKGLTWSSSSTSVATVDQSGEITAVGVGTANITVTTVDGSRTATVDVTVIAATIKVSSVSISGPSAINLVVGNIKELATLVLPNTATNPVLSWRSSNDQVATVNQSGFVTGVAVGPATITVTTTDGSNITKTVTVTVTAAPSVPAGPQLISTTVTPTVSGGGNAAGPLIWKTPGGAAGNIIRMTDGNKLTTGTHPDAPGLLNAKQIAIKRADGFMITFTFNSIYNNGKFIYYNKIASNQVDGSTIAFMLEGVVQESFVFGAGLGPGGNTHILEIEFIPSMNIQFDEVVLTFSGVGQVMRELEVFGIPVL